MDCLAFVDVDDTLLTPPYRAVRRVATLLGKQFPDEAVFINRSHLEYYRAFPHLFRSAAEMWTIALLSLPFGHFRSQRAMPMDTVQMGKWLADHRVYLLSKNPPSFTRWRIRRIRELFGVAIGDRYIACGPILGGGPSKLEIIKDVASARGVPLANCLLIDDSADNIEQAAAAGVRTVLVRSSWNASELAGLQARHPSMGDIGSENMPDVLERLFAGTPERDGRPSFLVPPLSAANVLRISWALLKRWWLYGEAPWRTGAIVPVARNAMASLLHSDPHAACCRRLGRLLTASPSLSGLRCLPLVGRGRPMLLPLATARGGAEQDRDAKVRFVRTVARDHMRASGHRFVRDAMFYFTALDRAGERRRVLSSAGVAAAKKSHAEISGASVEQVDALAKQHASELLTSRTYLSCLFGEWVLDTLLKRLLKSVLVKQHPAIKSLENDHFLFYAATHRSYLDSAVLWSILSHRGSSFPFAVGADKMRKVWFGRLGARGGTFFLRRRFVDPIYTAILAEHVAAMQKPGSVIEVFLEGQRSRSGLTLPPKKGIASIVWNNLGKGGKVAIVPVSFAYNKIPESEKIIKERFEERQRAGTLSLRDEANMRIRFARKKTLTERLRGTWRRLRSRPVSECFVNFAEPIVLDSAATQAGLQAQLNETMLRINAANEPLASSILCLFLLYSEDGHTTRKTATEFLNFAKAAMGLFELPPHLPRNFSADTTASEVSRFAELPFVNRKFKRSRLAETAILSIDDLDIERATYYKNNVLHFFVLPAVLSHVLQVVHSGHIEVLHRCFDHVVEKLQATYFLPPVKSARGYIDDLLGLLATRGLLSIAEDRWVVNDSREHKASLLVLTALGREIVHKDLPDLLSAFQRSSRRVEVEVPARLSAKQVALLTPGTLSRLSATELLVASDLSPSDGDPVSLSFAGTVAAIHGTVARVGEGSFVLRPTTVLPPAQDLGGPCTVEREVIDVGTVKNLSPSGAFIATELRLPAKTPLICSLVHGEHRLNLEASVARITQDGVGVQFTALTEESRARIVLLSAQGTAETV